MIPRSGPWATMHPRGAEAPILSHWLLPQHTGRMGKLPGSVNAKPREKGTAFDIKATAREEAVEAERKRTQPTLSQGSWRSLGKEDASAPVRASESGSAAASVAAASTDRVRVLVKRHFPVSGKHPSVTVISDGKWTAVQKAAPDLWTFRPKREAAETEEDWRKRCIPLREGAVWEITRGAP
jgi:hypothetical protein